MNAARRPPQSRSDVRALRVSADGRVREVPRASLLDDLGPGDTVVFNDAATLPASLPARRNGQAREVRLAGPIEDREGWFVLFGAGSWREDTDARPPPAPVTVGDRLDVAGLVARAVAVSPVSQRLVQLRFDVGDSAIIDAIYRHGRAVQYSHLDDDLELWSVQTIWAGRPWAVEMPSAARSFTWAEVGRLRERGLSIATLTHAAGLSATGDPALDAVLPLPERFEIPEATVRAIAATRRAGGRVVAVGTSAARALEGSALQHGALRAGNGITTLRLGATSPRRVVDSIVTGMHAPGESHFELLGSFVDAQTLLASHAFAARAGFASHEFGDVAVFEGERASRPKASRPSLARDGQHRRRHPSATACSGHRPGSSA